MSNCGGNCGSASSYNCGNGCLSYSETTTTTETFILGVAPVKMHFEGGSEMGFGAENGCKCGDNCTCDPCNCK